MPTIGTTFFGNFIKKVRTLIGRGDGLRLISPPSESIKYGMCLTWGAAQETMCFVLRVKGFRLQGLIFRLRLSDKDAKKRRYKVQTPTGWLAIWLSLFPSSAVRLTP